MKMVLTKLGDQPQAAWLVPCASFAPMPPPSTPASSPARSTPMPGWWRQDSANDAAARVRSGVGGSLVHASEAERAPRQPPAEKRIQRAPRARFRASWGRSITGVAERNRDRPLDRPENGRRGLPGAFFWDAGHPGGRVRRRTRPGRLPHGGNDRAQCRAVHQIKSPRHASPSLAQP
jgi:hypothetical protein